MSAEVRGSVRIGPLLVFEGTLSTFTKVDLSVDALVSVTGWESRNLAILDHGLVGSEKNILLDFAPYPDVEPVMLAQREKFLTHFSPKSEPLALGTSIALDENLHLIKTRLRALSAEGVLSVLFNISCLPKSYIQSLTAWIFTEGLFPRVLFGYAEGKYLDGIDGRATDKQVSFEVAQPLFGRAGASREKNLIVILGGEKANCYSLVEKVGPDRLHIVATDSVGHPELSPAIEAQLARLRMEYADRVASVASVDAYSIRDLWLTCKTVLEAIPNDQATTLFAAGTKPHALGAALCGLALREALEIRFRRTSKYPTSDVAAGQRFFVYEVLDLRSERLPDCKTW